MGVREEKRARTRDQILSTTVELFRERGFAATRVADVIERVGRNSAGLHVLGGIIAFSYVVAGALRDRFSSQRSVAVDVTATYWHFMDGLWIFLFILLFVWR